MITEISERDIAIVRYVARFGQMSALQVCKLLYSPATASKTPCNRALRRLVDRGFLARVERRIVGGSRGGSGVYVYALGRRGFFMFFKGKFSPPRSIRYHSLAIVDCVVALREAEREGKLAIIGLSSEPDCWVRIGRDELKPDLYVELERRDKRPKLFIEVDMGSESQGQVRAKLERYVRARENADTGTWPKFPPTLWACIDAERETELRWIISRMPERDHESFIVTTISGLADFLS